MYMLCLVGQVQFVHLSPSLVVHAGFHAKLMKRANYAGFEIKFYTALPRIVEVGHVTWH